MDVLQPYQSGRQKNVENTTHICTVCKQPLRSKDFAERSTEKKIIHVCSSQTCRIHFEYACGFAHGFILCQALCRLLDKLTDKKHKDSTYGILRKNVPSAAAPKKKIKLDPSITVPLKNGIISETASSMPPGTSAVSPASPTDLYDGELTVTFSNQQCETVKRLHEVNNQFETTDRSFKAEPEFDLTSLERSVPSVPLSAQIKSRTAKPEVSTSISSETKKEDLHCSLASDKETVQCQPKVSAKPDSLIKSRVKKSNRKSRNRETCPRVTSLNPTVSVNSDTSTQPPKKRRRKDREGLFKCDICFKILHDKSNLKAHMKRMHSGDDPVECDVCGRLSKSAVSLAEHKKRVHTSSGKMCYICGAQIQSAYGLKLHLTTHDGVKSHFCDICGDGFVRQSSLRYHRKLHTEVRAFLCELCSTSFKTAEGLNIHLLSKHKSGPYFDNRVRALEKMGVKVDKEAIKRYASHQCVVCEETLISGRCPTHPDVCQEVFKCDECDQSKKDIVEFHLHMKHHRGEKIPQWPSMKGKRVQRVQPVHHIQPTHRDPPAQQFQCKVCSQVFNSSSRLGAHRKLHEEKQYACQVCSRKFTYKCNLKTHLLTHTEARPFQCEVCLKTFKHKQLLKNHEYLHNSDAAPHKCKICGKSLTRKQNLENHYKLIHPETQAS